MTEGTRNRAVSEDSSWHEVLTAVLFPEGVLPKFAIRKTKGGEGIFKLEYKSSLLSRVLMIFNPITTKYL